MTDVTQILVGKHMTGIIDLTPALAEVSAQCRGMTDHEIAARLVEKLAGHNYIPSNLRDLYADAFLREFKKYNGEPAAAAPPRVLQIKVLGPGCPRCDRLEQDAMSVIAECGIQADLAHVRDPAEIARYGVMGSPALVVGSEVKAVGTVPPKAKLKAWFEEAAGSTAR